MMKSVLARFGKLEWFALVIVGAILIAALVPQWIAPFDPLRTGAGRPVSPPAWPYLLGTDELGRDVFSRLVWGARLSLLISVCSTAAALLMGFGIGAVVAMRKDPLGLAVTLGVNLILVFPGVVLAIALATVLGPSAVTTGIVLSVLYTPPIARLVATTIEAESGKSYVAALQVLGAGRLFMLRRAIGPAIAATILTFALVILADAVLLEAALSFIGVGVQAPAPSWGNIVSGGRPLMSSGRWWVATSGGVAIVLFALSVNMLGDAMGGRYRAAPSKKPTRYASPAPMKLAEHDNALLEVRDLTVRIPSHYGDMPIVDKVSFSVGRGEVVALVGESGSGKTLIAQAALGLLPRGAQATGSIRFSGQQVLNAPETQLRRLRGTALAFLPQDSIAALNPVVTVRRQMELILGRGTQRRQQELLDQVRLPARILEAYPHELSGGQAQRIALAMALSRRPALLIADEPTTALDVSVQAEIFELIGELRKSMGFSMLLISHDLALVSTVSDTINVAYAGRIVEQAPTTECLEHPRHPYSLGLVRAIGSLEQARAPLYHIPGTVPNPLQFAKGCRFSGRCEHELTFCSTVTPQMTSSGDRHFACHNPIVAEEVAYV